MRNIFTVISNRIFELELFYNQEYLLFILLLL